MSPVKGIGQAITRLPKPRSVAALRANRKVHMLAIAKKKVRPIPKSSYRHKNVTPHPDLGPESASPLSSYRRKPVSMGPGHAGRVRSTCTTTNRQATPHSHPLVRPKQGHNHSEPLKMSFRAKPRNLSRSPAVTALIINAPTPQQPSFRTPIRNPGAQGHAQTASAPTPTRTRGANNHIGYFHPLVRTNSSDDALRVRHKGQETGLDTVSVRSNTVGSHTRACAHSLINRDQQQSCHQHKTAFRPLSTLTTAYAFHAKWLWP